jgi:hypothetical protein
MGALCTIYAPIRFVTEFELQPTDCPRYGRICFVLCKGFGVLAEAICSPRYSHECVSIETSTPLHLMLHS